MLVLLVTIPLLLNIMLVILVHGKPDMVMVSLWWFRPESSKECLSVAAFHAGFDHFPSLRWGQWRRNLRAALTGSIWTPCQLVHRTHRTDGIQWISALHQFHCKTSLSHTHCDMAIRAGSKETCMEIRFKDGPCPLSVLLFPFQGSIQFRCSLTVSSLRLPCFPSKKRASSRSKYKLHLITEL